MCPPDAALCLLKVSPPVKGRDSLSAQVPHSAGAHSDGYRAGFPPRARSCVAVLSGVGDRGARDLVCQRRAVASNARARHAAVQAASRPDRMLPAP